MECIQFIELTVTDCTATVEEIWLSVQCYKDKPTPT